MLNVTDKIVEVGINSLRQLYVKPEKVRFPMIWRSASEVHWNDKELYLYSPEPREWPYLMWYNHILEIAEQEYHCRLLLTEHTRFANLDQSLIEALISITEI